MIVAMTFMVKQAMRRVIHTLAWSWLVVVFAATAAAEDSYYTLQPCRVLDTRSPNIPVPTNTPIIFGVAGLCGVPAEATSVSVNATLLPQNGISVDLGAFPGDLYAMPPTNNVVSGTPQRTIIAGSAILPLSTDGRGTIAVLANSASTGTTHLILDANGYFKPATFPSGWPGPGDDDPGTTDDLTSETYTDTLGQDTMGLSPQALVPGQGGANGHYFVSSGQPVPAHRSLGRQRLPFQQNQ